MKFKIETRGRDAFVKIDGPLKGDLTADFSALCAGLRGDRIVFDLRGIDQINSPGVAQWTHFLGALSVPYEFHDVPVLLVDYANLMSGTLGDATIVSFAVPHRCKACGRSFTARAVASTARASGALPPAPCPDCGKAAASEVEAEDYLVFLAR